MTSAIPRTAGFAALLAAGLLLVAASQTFAAGGAESPIPGTRTVASRYDFETLVGRLQNAIGANRMGLVAQASASRGAAAQGVAIPGNAVLMVFRNDFAVRMLAASVAAGIEAPLRLYVTENEDGTASLTYRLPSAVFAPYQSADLDAMAKELDSIIERIVGQESERRTHRALARPSRTG